MYWKMVKWRRGSAKQRQYYLAKGWFFNDENGNPVGPFKTRKTAVEMKKWR